MSELAELKAEIAALRKEIAELRAERTVHHHYHQAPHQPLYQQPQLDPRYYPYQPNWLRPYCGTSVSGQAIGIGASCVNSLS